MREIDLQQQVADYIRLRYPSVIFHSDFGSGIKLTMGQAIKQKRLNGGRRSWPDMFLAEPDIGKTDGFKKIWFGLFIELKREGTRILKRDGTLVADQHIREQHALLVELERRGYMARFAVGFDQAKQIIDEYLGGPATEKVEF